MLLSIPTGPNILALALATLLDSGLPLLISVGMFIDDVLVGVAPAATGETSIIPSS